MKAVGIICEYNPFHNGHLFHLNKVKEQYPEDVIVLVMSGNFTQRGEPSVISKWDKTKIALHYGIDLVVELPFPFVVQSADTFAKGAISLLKSLGVSTLVFGSESNNVDQLSWLANVQIHDSAYQEEVQNLLKQGYNYPTALSKALSICTTLELNSPNDILGLSYIREIIKQEANIQPITIQRTNAYHEKEQTGPISSATSIRAALQEKKEIINSIPTFAYPFYQGNLHFKEDYFAYLKYQIYVSWNHLSTFLSVDEGLETRIQKAITKASTYEELIQLVKTKRYTYQRLNRMFTHILCGFTKEEALLYQDITYIRVLGFSKKGQTYLHEKKKSCPLPLIMRYASCQDAMLQKEKQITAIYASTLNTSSQQEQIEMEYKTPPLTSD